MSSKDDGSYIIRMRGMPWATKEEEVISFLNDVTIKNGKQGIHFATGSDGRTTGEAYVELTSSEDLEKAINHHNEHMGRRYIEIFKSTLKEMQFMASRSHHGDDAVVRLRGLPYGCTKEEIAHFFSGLEIVPNGIGLLMDAMGRTTGEAYVQFANTALADRAREQHMDKIGHRYIEIFNSNMTEAECAIQKQMAANMAAMSGGGGGGGGSHGYGSAMRSGGMRVPTISRGCMGRPSPYGRPGMNGGGGGSGGGMGGGGISNLMRGNIKGLGPRGGIAGAGGRLGTPGSDWNSTTGHSIHLRGLPFSATEGDVLSFLQPLQPVNIEIHFENGGRPSGEADVDFATHDEAKEAMKKDRGKMGTRYIELFLNSTPNPRRRGGDGSMMLGNMMGGGVNCNVNDDFDRDDTDTNDYVSDSQFAGGFGSSDYENGFGFQEEMNDKSFNSGTMMGGNMSANMSNMGSSGMGNMGGGVVNLGNLRSGGMGKMNFGISGMNSSSVSGGMSNMGEAMSNMGSGMGNMGVGGGLGNIGGSGGGGMNNLGCGVVGGMGNMGVGGGMGNLGGSSRMGNMSGGMCGNMGNNIGMRNLGSNMGCGTKPGNFLNSNF